MALVPRIKPTMVEDGAITSTKLADNSVTNTKVLDSAISNTKIANGSVSTGKLDATMTQYVVVTTSGQFAFPADNAVASWAHGLGVMPSRYKVVLICVSGEYGYGAGTEIDITSNLDGDGGRGTTTAADTANVYVRSNSWSQYYVSRYDGGVNTIPLTPANWRIVFRAWK